MKKGEKTKLSCIKRQKIEPAGSSNQGESVIGPSCPTRANYLLSVPIAPLL